MPRYRSSSTFLPHNFCILLVSKRINKTSTIQQDETNKQCPNANSFINIEESFLTKSVKVIPATVGQLALPVYRTSFLHGRTRRSLQEAYLVSNGGASPAGSLQ